MSQDNLQTLSKVMLGAAVFATLGIGGTGVYMVRQAAELAASGDALAQEVKALRSDLASQAASRAKALAAAPAQRTADDPSSAVVVAALREALDPLAKQIAELDASMRRQAASRPMAATASPPQMPVPPSAMPAGVGKGGSAARGGGPGAVIETLPKETRERVDAIFQRQSEGLRSRIAAETDPERPDPEVMMRVMSQSQAELASELSGVLSPEEYDAMFPPMPGVGLAPGGGGATKGKSQSFK